MKVGPHVMTPIRHAGPGLDLRIPRVGRTQTGGNLKLIQCQLMLLLHARRCQQRHELVHAKNEQQTVPEEEGKRDEVPEVANDMAKAILLNCPIRHCRVMKEVLNHMKTCRLGGICTYQHCTTSIRILSHWTNCTTHDCPLCMLVRSRMRMAKEWEATLPRSSRYTLLAAALRSSQGPRHNPPNCQVAEQAQEGRSGVPCQEELDDLQQQCQSCHRPLARMCYNRNCAQHRENADVQTCNSCDKEIRTHESCGNCMPVRVRPSLDQVRNAYEQLGIPCPEQALQRLMTTLGPQSIESRHSQYFSTQEAAGSDEPEDLTTDDVRMEQDNDGRNSNADNDQGIFDCSCPCPSSHSTDSTTPAAP